MPRNAIVRADGIAVRCPECGRAQGNGRGMLVWTSADLAAHSARGERGCQYESPRFGAKPCSARFVVRLTTRVKLEEP